MNLQTTVILLCCISGAFCFSVRKTTRAACPPKPETVKELNTTEYFGRWYQQTGLPAFFQPSGTKCISANYGPNDDGTISVRNTEVNTDDSYREICGYAEVPDPEFPGELQVYFSLFGAGSYLLLDTDYENFASVYSCTDLAGLVKFEYAWLLTREKNPSQEVIDRGLQAYLDQGISIEEFETIYQGDDCIFENPDGTSCLE